MSHVTISVENLSKRYVIGHQAGQRERYAALRDVIEREARNFLRKTSDLFHGRQIVQGDEVEEFWALREVSFEKGRMGHGHGSRMHLDRVVKHHLTRFTVL